MQTLVKLIATATSGLVSFTTNVIRPVKVICEFSPVQAEGTPSPGNPLPISGWTGCEITHTSENLLVTDGGFPGIIITPSGNFQNHNDFWTSNYFAISPGDYVATSEVNEDLVICLCKGETLSSMKRTYIGEENMPYHFTVSEPYTHCRICVYKYKSSEHPGGVLAKTITKRSIPFAAPSTGDPMTVYGGTVTLNEDGSADLVVTKRGIIYDGSEDEGWAGTSSTFYVPAPPDCKKTQIPIGNWLKGVQNISYITLPNLSFAMTTSPHNYVNFKYNSVSSLDAFKQLLEATPFIAVYDLVTPVIYHFPSIAQLNSFLGQNNIWHNMNGSITAEYYKRQ